MPARQPPSFDHRWLGGWLIALAAILPLLPAGAAAQSRTNLARSRPVAQSLAVPQMDDGYWIVSARDCEGRLGPSQTPHFRVWRFDKDGRGREATLPEFYGSLIPQVPVCFMMHGSFVDWETVREDSRRTNLWLRAGASHCPVHIVFFSWPSDDTPMIWLPIDVAILGRRAGRHGFYVAEMISMIPDHHPISLVGHSHGARMVVSTLHVLGGGQVEDVAFAGGPYHQHRIRAVLAAAAFDHNWLNPGERYERAVQRPEGVLNLLNRRDLALGLYPLHRPLMTVAAAARSGFTRGDRQEMGALARKIIDYDITERVGPGHIWPHYYADTGISRVISPYVFFNDAPASATVRASSEPLVQRLPSYLESHGSGNWQLQPTVERR